MQIFGPPYLAPAGTPPDRVATLGRAFAATMKDPEFLADAKRTGSISSHCWASMFNRLSRSCSRHRATWSGGLPGDAARVAVLMQTSMLGAS